MLLPLLLVQSGFANSVETAAVVAAVSPHYPDLARQANVFGDVSAEVKINYDGVVESVKIILGHALFQQAAEMAAFQLTAPDSGALVDWAVQPAAVSAMLNFRAAKAPVVFQGLRAQVAAAVRVPERLQTGITQ